MNAKTQHNNILLAIIGFATVVVIVGVIGFFAFSRKPEVIQGQVEVSEYRVSSKVPGRILEIRVKEGDFVKVGDTLAILDAPEVRAKMEQAQSAQDAASAIELKAQNGAREEQIRGAYNVLQQAKAGVEIAEKSYKRIQRLFDEGVVSEQKRDEVYAQYKAMEAQMQAAQSQYDMAVNGARREDKLAAAAQVGKEVHLSGGVGLGGVLEPVQANPVIIEDHCFIGSRCIVVEGVHVEREAVLGAGTVLTASTKIVDVTGPEPVVYHGRVPARSVVIPGTMPKRFPAGEYGVPCALIIGQRKESTDKKTSLNDALRLF